MHQRGLMCNPLSKTAALALLLAWLRNPIPLSKSVPIK